MTNSKCIDVQLVVFKIVIGTKWQTVTLADAPRPGSVVDSCPGGKGIRDWDEIDTKGEFAAKGLLKWDNNGITKLPTVQEALSLTSWGNSVNRFGAIASTLPGNTKFLPVTSNPTVKSTANDGYSDFDKREVFTKHRIQFCKFRAIVFSFETKNGTVELIPGEKEAMFVGVHEVKPLDLIPTWNFHTSIAVFATPFSELYSEKSHDNESFREVIGGTNRLRAMTFGAGDGDPNGNYKGNLISRINRPRDAEMQRKVEMIRLLPTNVVNSFNVLDTLEKYYRDNYTDLKYDIFTDKGSYNSNSFTHGLIIAANITILRGPNFTSPGWDKPLPMSYFGAPA